MLCRLFAVPLIVLGVSGSPRPRQIDWVSYDRACASGEPAEILTACRRLLWQHSKLTFAPPSPGRSSISPQVEATMDLTAACLGSLDRALEAKAGTLEPTQLVDIYQSRGELAGSVVSMLLPRTDRGESKERPEVVKIRESWLKEALADYEKVIELDADIPGTHPAKMNVSSIKRRVRELQFQLGLRAESKMTRLIRKA